MPDIHEIRKEFPIFENMKSGEVLPFAYLDNAATSQRPKCVIDAEMELYEKHNANPLRGSYPLSVEATDIYENARKSVRKFINADTSSEIVFTRNTSESINLVAYSYGLSYVGEGDEVLVSIMEHHSNLLPWQMVTRKTGAKLKFIECENDGSIDLEKIKALINEKTKIVAITHVSNVLGYENPVKEIAKLAHEKGAVIVVDGAQSTPHIKIDVKEMDVDFFAFSGHKMFGPMGIGVLYGKEEILDKMPPFLTGGEMIDSVSRYDAVYAELPHKFEAGTVNAAGAAGLDAAIKFMNKIGYEYMQERELMLTKRALDGMIKIPHITVYGSDKAKNHTGILTFKIDDVHPHDISEVLIADGIAVRAGHHCAQPLLQYLGVNSTTRASFMFYNTEEEIDRFLESIATVRERMGYGK
ncbi:MAG: SufS family cysteine desulfurase [Lachnospiraceae bacterium]|nr:SufS family cysteine desulfurase [Lachnospiraceae bacterium]